MGEGEGWGEKRRSDPLYTYSKMPIKFEFNENGFLPFPNPPDRLPPPPPSPISVLLTITGDKPADGSHFNSLDPAGGQCPPFFNICTNVGAPPPPPPARLGSTCLPPRRFGSWVVRSIGRTSSRLEKRGGKTCLCEGKNRKQENKSLTTPVKRNQCKKNQQQKNEKINR